MTVSPPFIFFFQKMPSLVMSPLFMCICVVAGVSSFDAHTALEWAVHEGHIREDGYIKTNLKEFASQMALQFHTIPHYDYKIQENGRNSYSVLDSNGDIIFEPPNSQSQNNENNISETGLYSFSELFNTNTHRRKVYKIKTRKPIKSHK